MSKSKEELVQKIAPYLDHNGRKELDLGSIIDQAHTAGKKARDEELLEMVEGKLDKYRGGLDDSPCIEALIDIKNELVDDKDTGFFRNEDNEPMWRNEDGSVEKYKHQDDYYGGPMCTFRWCKCQQ